MKRANLEILLAAVLTLLLVFSGCASSAPTGLASKEGSSVTATKPAPQTESTSTPKESTSAPAAKPAESKPASQKDPLQALYEAAKAEGEVAFWGASDPEEMKLLSEGFEKRFPGIRLKPFEIQPQQAVQRIVTEAQAGKVSADVIESSISSLLPLLEREMVQAHRDWTQVFKDIDPSFVVLDGKGITWYNLSHVIGYNTNQLKPEEVPKTWEALLDPKWKDGKLLVEVRGNAFAYLGLKWGEAKMLDYVRGIVAQKPIIAKGGTAVIQQLAAGEAPLAVGAYGYKILWYARDKKAPIDFIDTTTPMGGSHFVNAVVRGAPHPNAAKLLTGWLSTPEALNILLGSSAKVPLTPSVNSPEYQRLARNKVEFLFEREENTKQVEKLKEEVAKVLGAIK